MKTKLHYNVLFTFSEANRSDAEEESWKIWYNRILYPCKGQFADLGRTGLILLVIIVDREL